MKKYYKIFAIIIITLAAGTAVLWSKYHTEKPPYPAAEKETANLIPPLFTDKTFFLTAIRRASSTPVSGNVTGITVPHHLLAIDLIADTFNRIKNQKYNLVILISPDHYYLGSTSISVAEKNFSTVFGAIKTNRRVADEMIKITGVSGSDLFYREHGVQGELPFIKYYFPDTPIVALAIKPDTKRPTLDLLIENLKNLIGPETLIIQSTDFSHYLTKADADKKDVETISVLKNNDPEKILGLHQPDNIDSVAAQYIQSRLQKEFFDSQLVITNDRNSQAYTADPVKETTSYITQIYEK